MAAASATGPSSSTSALGNINDSKKRWMVFGLALKDLVDQIRSFVEKEVQKDYVNLKTSHGIDSQSSSGRLKKWGSTFLKYENINGNDAVPKLHGKFNYAAFDCHVTSHVDYAKLYLENYMAKFTVFDEHCDASAVLNLLGRVPVFSLAAQSAAHDVRQHRNAWAHCAFQDWDPAKFQQCFQDMKRLVNALGLPAADKTKLLDGLDTWERTGPSLCMNTSVNPALLRMVQQHVNKLITDVDKLVFEVECDRETVKRALQDVAADVKELEKRVSVLEKENKGLKRSMKSFQDEQIGTKERIKSLESEQESVKQRLTQVEEQHKSSVPEISFEISNFEADIAFLAERHDADTREWLFADINSWFHAPGDSRAYVLLGDAGVGKSVIAGALAKRAQDDGYLGAAYFCRHNDETRNDPRNLLGTIACQLCKCNVQYSNIVGGEGGIRMTLANSKLSIPGLFTKLLQEPLGKCAPCEQKKLVIIDALDETEYKSRDDFLDLVMHRFPRLPEWLLFFITSRPEDTVQFTLKNYNPCVKICAGYGKYLNVYQQHEQDIKRFLEKRVDFSRLPYTVEDVTRKCNGLFLYAFYMVEVLNNSARSGNMIGELNELFPGDIDYFFQDNFKRIFDKVGADLFRTLFGCVVASPSPLPRSFISFLLKREKLHLDEQEVIDTVSIFLVHRASDLTFTFLHNLIPSWLTDRNKARRFFVDITVAREYLKKIVLEFLPSSVINVSSGKYSPVKTDLLDYVLHVGVRLLCKCDDRDSMKIAHNFLTSYQFLQTRIQKSRIGVYSLIGDLKLSAGCQNLSEIEKEPLQGVCRALERNIHTLLECPHLLPSCLQMASKAVKLYMTIPDRVSTTWMEWSWLPFPAPKATPNKVRSCFAFSPDGKFLAEVKNGCISLYSSCSLERLLGPVKADELAHVKRLAFSSCGNFVFFGKFGRAFSVQRGIIETYFPLQTVHLSCDWCSFTLVQQHIVVKCDSLLTPTCWLCLLNHLCLWAKLEIEQSGKREPLCRCFPDKLKVTRKHPQLATQGSRITAMRPLLHLLSEMKCEEWCSLLEKAQLDRGDLTFLVPDCPRCKLSRDYEALTLEEVRQFVIDHYSEIFKYQVWDAQTGEPVLNVASSSGVEVCPFIHFWHLGTAFETCGTLFTGIDKALSLANIALLSTICHHLLFRKSRSLKWYFSIRFLKRLEWYCPRPDGTVSFMVDGQNVERVIKEIRCYAALEEDVVLYVTHEFRLCALCLQTGTTTVLHRPHPIMKVLEYVAVRHTRSTLDIPNDDTIGAPPLSTYTFTDLSNDDTYKALDMASALPTYTFTDLSNDDIYEAVEKASVLSIVLPKIAFELENLADEGKNMFFSGSIPCLSQGVIWVAKPFVKDAETEVCLFRVTLAYSQQQHSKRPKHVIKEVAQFGFTNDHSYFLYLSVDNSLHALCLQSGTILQSVSGDSPLFFVSEGHVGYHFQADDEGKALFLKDFPCDFLKHFLNIPSVKIPMQANFISDDTFLVVCTDSSVLSYQTASDLCTKTTFAEPPLESGLLGPWHVQKCAFSSDGKLIVAHHGKMITLHDTIGSDDCSFPCSVFEADHEFSVLQLTFSGDSALLLYCIRNCPFVVWDVRKRETLASFDPPGLVSEDFCCFFTVDKKIVFSTELHIEIWDPATITNKASTRLDVDVLCSKADIITYCTVSRNNDLLACCVVDRILLYSFNSPTNPLLVLKLPRAHLGKIEFCRFLNGKRYIISYGIDGAVFLWDLLERTAISFIRIPVEGENISFMTVSPKEDKVVGCTSCGKFFQITLNGLKSEMPSFQLIPQGKMMGHNATTLTGAVSSKVEEIAEETDTSKLVEEMDFMCPSDHSEDSDGDESENSGADQ